MDKRALVIEDDADIANLVAVSLRDINFQTDIISNGADGLRYATSRPYDVIILDIMLPGLDGIEVCRRIRQQQVMTPILMLTARTEEIDKVLSIDKVTSSVPCCGVCCWWRRWCWWRVCS